jgi:soluble lytic murein transglycosylase-like protein
MRLWPISPVAGIALAAVVLFGTGLFVLAAISTPRSQPRPAALGHKYHAALPAKLAVKPRIATLSDFQKEQRLSARQLLNRWDPLMAEASRRFNVPQAWIRAVMVVESGGRTMAGENRPLVSSAGALGLMQLMPDTYNDMRVQYGLGPDPHNPHDNILAGAAFLRRLFLTYGYPAMFSAYNDGPGNFEERLLRGELLPQETRGYVADITQALATGNGLHGLKAKFTRPDGTSVWIDTATVVSVRAAFSGEYAPGVLSVITAGRIHQGVRENVVAARAILRAHGGGI